MGMNSGVHDAFNLADKLVRILRGEADDACSTATSASAATSPCSTPRRRPSATSGCWPRTRPRRAPAQPRRVETHRRGPEARARIPAAHVADREPARSRADPEEMPCLGGTCCVALAVDGWSAAPRSAAGARALAGAADPLHRAVHAGSSSDTVARIVGAEARRTAGTAVGGRKPRRRAAALSAPRRSPAPRRTAIRSGLPIPARMRSPRAWHHPLRPGQGFRAGRDARQLAVPLALYPGVPAKTVPELIALAKAKPRALNYASAGPATLAHLSGALFEKMANIELTHVPYRGTAQSTARPDGRPGRDAVRHHPADLGARARRQAARARGDRRGAQPDAAGRADHRQIGPRRLRSRSGRRSSYRPPRRRPSSRGSTARSPRC